MGAYTLYMVLTLVLIARCGVWVHCWPSRLTGKASAACTNLAPRMGCRAQQRAALS